MNANVQTEEHSFLFKKRVQLIVAAVFVCTVAPTLQRANAQSEGRSGKDIVEKICITCHGTGANGAPKIGDEQAWSKRAAQGLTGLTQNALKGIREMPAHGGHPELTELEIGRAVTYMVNRSGGRWVEPIGPKDMVKERSGEQVVKAQCAKCHQSGKVGAPKIGDRDAWVARMKQGLDYLVHSAIRGHGGMPARGGMSDLTDTEIYNAVLYMFNPVGAPATGARGDNRAAGVSPANAWSNRVVVGWMEISLGVVPAQSLLAFPKDSPERTMHGGVPSGADYYHINISLSDSKTHAPIADAQVEIQVAQVGLTSESKGLELMAGSAASYGNYVKMKKNTPYVISVLIAAPNSSPMKTRFEYKVD